jgi:hypothetical protein
VVLESERTHQLRELLQQLPADQREALLLRFCGELGIGEIAARMGRSAGAIKMLIHRAVARLRERYRQAEQAAAQIAMLMAVAGGAGTQLQLAAIRTDQRPRINDQRRNPWA